MEARRPRRPTRVPPRSKNTKGRVVTESTSTASPPPNRTRYRERYLFDFLYMCRNGTRFRTHGWSAGSSKFSLKRPSHRLRRGSSSPHCRYTEIGGTPGRRHSSSSVVFLPASTQSAIGFYFTRSRNRTQDSPRSSV